MFLQVGAAGVYAGIRIVSVLLLAMLWMSPEMFSGIESFFMLFLREQQPWAIPKSVTRELELNWKPTLGMSR